MTLHGRPHQTFAPALHFFSGNQIDLLCNGSEYFEALLQDINRARESVRLETYLYADDPVGKAITEALCRAAQRGVDVRVVVDGFGARNITQQHRERFEAAGVKLRIFRPEYQLLRHLIQRRRARLRRMHRKLVLIDGRIGFVGGINIIDDATGNTDDIRLDFAVSVRGPLIGPIGHAIDRQWLTLSRLHALFQRGHAAASPTPLHLQPAGRLRAALALRDNLLHRRTIESAYLRAFQRAQHQITLAMAYFIPSRLIVNALLDASQRGVRVTLLLQGRIEYRLQHYASQALYHRLLASGIRIHEYRPGFMHAKVAVIDDTWCTIGSANLDPLSLLVAREANIVIRNRPFAVHLRQQLDAIIGDQSREITAELWMRKPGHAHLLRGLAARLLYRLVSLTGYASNY